MALWRAEVLTPWTEVSIGGEMAHAPLAAIEFRFATWSDVTAQGSSQIPPEPNLMAIEGEVEKADLDALRLDSRFACVWFEPVEGSSAEMEARDAVTGEGETSRLQGYLMRSGVGELQLGEALGGVEGKTRGEVGEKLRAWLSERPKGKEISRVG